MSISKGSQHGASSIGRAMSCSKKCFAVSVPDQIPEHSNPVSGGKGNSPIILAYHPDQAGQGKDDYF